MYGRRRTIRDEAALQREKLLRPREKPYRQKIGDFFWDPQEKTCLTRTPSNWFSICFYYAIFLLCIFLLFYISIYISEKVVERDPDRPQYILDDSPIGEAPSITFFPLVGSRNLIWLSESRSYNKYVDDISAKFKKYKRANKKFNSTTFGECSKPPFGYDKKTPCLFFRLTRILMWKPMPYEKDDDELPEDMPEEVKKLIVNSATPRVWMSCNGTTAKDRDHITQDFFQMIGEKGFDVSAFPYKKQKNYTDSIIAIKFTDSKPTKVLYSFTCLIWAKEVDAKKTAVDVTYYFE